MGNKSFKCVNVQYSSSLILVSWFGINLQSPVRPSDMLIKIIVTRRHSIGMPTVRCSGRLIGGGGWGVSAQSGGLSGGVCLGGVHLPPVVIQTPVKTLPSQTSFAGSNYRCLAVPFVSVTVSKRLAVFLQNILQCLNLKKYGDWKPNFFNVFD